MTETPLRIGYVTGYGRSGSTVLDIVLGEHSQLFGAGELTNFSRRVWPNNEYCSCGATVRDCPFWSVVAQQFLSRFGQNAFADYAKLQVRFENLSVVARSRVGLVPQAGRKEYGAYTRGLFEIVAKLSGKPIIIDSSKIPGRAAALLNIDDIDLRIIHLVRDGRAVAWSMLKPYEVDAKVGLERRLPGRSVPRTALRWSMVNLGAESVAQRVDPDKSARLSYEAFVSKPADELARLGKVLGVDMGDLVSRLESGPPFSATHVVAGSRWRMGGPITLRLDQEWRRTMPAHERHKFQVLSGWLQRRYGYPDA